MEGRRTRAAQLLDNSGSRASVEGISPLHEGILLQQLGSRCRNKLWGCSFAKERGHSLTEYSGGCSDTAVVLEPLAALFAKMAHSPSADYS